VRRIGRPGAAPAALLAVQLAGCAEMAATPADGSRVSDDSASTYVYECDNRDPITVRVTEGKAWLFLPSQTIDLPRIVSASGARFSDGESSYWSKGEEARFELQGQTLSGCTNNRSLAVWEDAKLRGADFRASGNEPGWNLEIFDGESVAFVNNYGQDRHLFSAPPPEVDRAVRATTYRLQNRDHRLLVVVQGKPCRDSMSGEAFAATVTLIFDGKPLSGCGRALH